MERVRISDIAFGGDGVGRLADGSVVFVPFTAVGDDVTIEITERKSSFCRGSVITVNEPGQGRAAPQCRHFGECGGCAYQHLEYPVEFAAKLKQFKDLMHRLGKFEDFPEPEAFAAPEPYGYRNKLRLEPFGRVLDDKGYHLDYGYCKRDNETFFKVKSCPLARSELNALLPKAIRSDWGYQNARREAPYPLTLRVDSTGATGFYFGKASPKLPWLNEMLLGHNYRVPTGSFWQVNPAVAELVLAKVKGWLEDSTADTLIDAYGGVGTFSLALGIRMKKRILIESDSSAITAADYNHKAAALSCDIISDTTEKAIDKVLRSVEPDKTAVIIDPPRTGCHQMVLEALRRTPLNTVVYVSCNLATLARDLRLLCSGGVYVPVKSAMFDMFPRTAHFENAVLLKAGVEA